MALVMCKAHAVPAEPSDELFSCSERLANPILEPGQQTFCPNDEDTRGVLIFSNTEFDGQDLAINFPPDTGIRVGGKDGYHSFNFGIHFVHPDLLPGGYTGSSGVVMTIINLSLIHI